MKFLLIVFSLVWGCHLAHSQEPANEQAASEATEEQTAEPPRSKFGTSFSTNNNPGLLSQDLPPEQILWLDIADEQTLSLYSPDHSGRARGGVILFPRHDQPITINSRLFNLQQTLADNRWHALTVSMPAFSTEDLDKGLPKQYFDAAIKFLNDKGIYNMVILSEGQNAHRLLQFANRLNTQGQSKQIRGLAIVNPINIPEPTAMAQPATPATLIEELIPKLPFPILDIYFDDNLQAKRSAKTRLRNSRSMRAKQYQQVRMLRLSGNAKDHEDRLSKRVRGWLDKTAAGFSIGIK